MKKCQHIKSNEMYNKNMKDESMDYDVVIMWKRCSCGANMNIAVRPERYRQSRKNGFRLYEQHINNVLVQE